ncbi:hypothetical protein Agub_g230, partial [Astrephomene gubernaculifera]
MRFLAFSANTGACLTYHDFGRRDGGSADEGAATASRLFNMNQLLLQATHEPGGSAGGSGGGGADPSGAPAAAGAAASVAALRSSGGGGAADSGSTTILGAGMRRMSAQNAALGRPKGLSAPARPLLAVRQWHVGRQQWQLAEDADTQLLVAVCVDAAWDANAAAFLAKALRDAFVTANRPQLLALARTAPTLPPPLSSSSSITSPTATPASGRTASSSAASITGASAVAPGGPGSASGGLSRPPSVFRAAPTGGPPELLTLPALKLLCRLAQAALGALAAGGLQPCWLFFAHVDSFM